MTYLLLIPEAIAQIFNPVAELVIAIVIPRKEANAEIEIHPVIAEAKNKNVFSIIYLSTHFISFLQGNNFLFHLFL